MNFDDVDIKVFDFDNLDTIVANLSNIAIGTNIWVAKANSYNWNIYRNNLVNAVITTVVDNLDGTSTLTFNTNHNLLKDTRIVVKFFDDEVDGAYIVESVPSLQTITVSLSLSGDTTTLTGIGLVLSLESVRFAGPDIVNASFGNNIVRTKHGLMIMETATGQYYKINPFGTAVQLDADTIQNDLFGTTIEQGLSDKD